MSDKITVEEMVAHIDSIKYVETERDAEVLQAIRKLILGENNEDHK